MTYELLIQEDEDEPEVEDLKEEVLIREDDKIPEPVLDDNTEIPHTVRLVQLLT